MKTNQPTQNLPDQTNQQPPQIKRLGPVVALRLCPRTCRLGKELQEQDAVVSVTALVRKLEEPESSLPAVFHQRFPPHLRWGGGGSGGAEVLADSL